MLINHITTGVKKMFFSMERVKKAFKRVKNDMGALKDSVNEWILFLNGEQRDLKMRVIELEKRLHRLEMNRPESEDLGELREL